MGQVVARTVSTSRIKDALTRLERDLKDLGMTDGEIHEVRPDAPSSPTAFDARVPKTVARAAPSETR
jgi:hypothetical protein